MFCRNCGKEMDNNTNYCSICGAALKDPADASAIERIGSYTQFDMYSHPNNITANRKELPVKGSLSFLPLFGIMGIVLMVITLMVTFYSYNMIAGLQKNLQQYYNELNDDSLVGRIGGSVMDFFTDGALTQKREDIQKMEQDLINGKNAMSAGLVCALLSVLTGLAGVLRNIKRPAEGRGFFLFSIVFSLVTPVLVFIACTMLYLINTILLLNITSSIMALIMLVIESQRLKIIKAAYMHNYGYPRKRLAKAAKE